MHFIMLVGGTKDIKSDAGFESPNKYDEMADHIRSTSISNRPNSKKFTTPIMSHDIGPDTVLINDYVTV